MRTTRPEHRGATTRDPRATGEGSTPPLATHTYTVEVPPQYPADAWRTTGSRHGEHRIYLTTPHGPHLLATEWFHNGHFVITIHP